MKAASTLLLAIGCCVLALAAPAARKPEVAIRLKDAVIVRDLPTDRLEKDDYAKIVGDLALVLERRTGVKPSVADRLPPGATAAIFLGPAALRESGEDVSGLRRGDWRIKAVPGRVFLLGRGVYAANAAVVEFAERFCDYFFLTLQGDDPCVCDPEATVPVCDMTVRPAVYKRTVSTGLNNGHSYPTVVGQLRNWKRRWRGQGFGRSPSFQLENDYRYSPQTLGCHSSFDYLPPEKWFKVHPEWYSMRTDGKRYALAQNRSQLCYSNREAREEIYASLERFVAADRAANPTNYPTIYDFSQQDNSDFLCHCPDCKKVIAKYNRVPGGHKEGGDAGLQLECVNELARRIRVKYPDVKIRTFAYVSTECPPKPGTLTLEPNVVIWWCDVYSYSDHTLPLNTPGHYNRKQADEIEEWLRLARHVEMWDYMLYTDDFPEVSPDAIKADAQYLSGLGLESIYFESEFHHQPFWELNHFLFRELYIRPGLDVDKLIHKYCRVYGAAAPTMEAAIQDLRRTIAASHAETPNAWHSRNLPWLTDANLTRFAEAFQRAYAKAGDDARARQRIANALAATWKKLYWIRRVDPKRSAAAKAAGEKWLRFAREEIAGRFMEDKDRPAALAALEEEFALANLHFTDLPAELQGVSEADLICLDYHATTSGRTIVNDPRSECGKALKSNRDDRAGPVSQPVNCGVYDDIAKENRSYSVDGLKEGDGYRWLKLGETYVGRSSYFWFPGNWASNVSFVGRHILADGLAVDPNHYDFWVSARYEKGTLYVDRVVLRRLGKGPKK